jgi:hypothetical protein
MSSCILLDVPVAVSRHIIVEWLNVKQVVQLDSAFCGTLHAIFANSIRT